MFIHQYPSSSLNFGPCIHAHRPSATDQGWLRRLWRSGGGRRIESREGKKNNLAGFSNVVQNLAVLCYMFFFKKIGVERCFCGRKPQESNAARQKYEGPSLMLLTSSLGVTCDHKIRREVERLLFPDS